MALASPTPWVEGTQTALAAANPMPLPTFTPATDFSPVLYGGKLYGTTSFLLLGGVSRDAWLGADVSVALFAGEATYSLHTLEQVYKYFVWGNAPEFSAVCKSYSVGTDAGLDEVGYVAVRDGWNITKRAVAELSDGDGVYQQAALDWLKAEGVTKPELGDLHIYRVDLEGDGPDEIFISATRYDGSNQVTKTGDHSVILMRKVQGNEVVTVFIAGDVYRGPETATLLPRTYSIANFIDLNQDGVLEVVVDIQRWEGFGAAVFQVEDQTVTQVLKAGCGL